MSVTRRLAAILAADVAGYSRLMAADEAGTLARFNALKAEVIQPQFTQYGGILVGSAGDSLLVEFPSVVDAVQCAVEIQQRIAERNADESRDRRIVFRVGVNLGDVIAEGGTIHGDGVNVASRLEKLAEPGSIVIARAVHDQVKGKLAYAFADLGEQRLKNITEPVLAIQINVSGADASSTPASHQPVPALPAKPSIAVLPFTNMSGDPEQEHFADGIAEDLITALSKIRWFFVIARNSTFAFKGTSVDITEVGRRLGVRYVLEGSVRKGGKRVRVTAQLVEAGSGHHVWAERYDRDLEDIFALQDEMTQTIIRAIEPELSEAERERAIRKPPGNLDAWELFQRGLWHHFRFTKDDNAQAKSFFARAVDADPTFAQAHAALAHADYWDALFGFSPDPDAAIAHGLDHARRSVALDAKEPYGHFALGRVLTLRADLDAAIAELERAIELNANFAHAYYGLGWALILAGRCGEALDRIETAMRLNPNDPAIWTFHGGGAMALLFLDRLDEAEAWVRRSVHSPTTGMLAHVIDAIVQTEMGRDRAAAAALSEARRIKPNLTPGFIRSVMPFRDPAKLDRILRGLAEAGLEA